MVASIDAGAVDALGDERLDWRCTAIPASAHGMSVAEVRATQIPLDDVDADRPEVVDLIRTWF